MSRTQLVVIALGVLCVACKSSSAPEAFGPLESKIVAGRVQNVIAGQWSPTATVNLTFRNPLTGAMIQRPNLLERALLPTVAYAMQSVGIKVQPNSVACVSEDQTILIPVTRCVNSDALGQSRFDFIETHVAGTHQARLNATYGLEATTFDTATIVVLPDVPNPNYQSQISALLTSPAVIPAEAMEDKYGNPVPFLIVSDKTVAAQDTVAGSLGARTLVFTGNTNNQEVFTELRGPTGALIGHFAYSIGVNTKQINWRSVGSAIVVP